VRSVAALACVAALAAGCGSEIRKESSKPAPREEPRPAETAPTPTRAQEDARSATAYGFMSAAGEEDPRPVVELFGVFDRPGTEAEIAMADQAKHFADPEGNCGEVIRKKTRILLTDVGATGRDLVAAPTSKGFVAYGVVPDGGGGCGRPMKGGLMIGGDISPDSALHYGLVADDVEWLEVVVEGVSHKARMGRNGFAVMVEGNPDKIPRVVLHRHDGTTETIF
jgi:hypothetical protein